jgi:hypothetical protein
MPLQARLSLWKNFFLTNKELDSSNLHMEKIKKASAHAATFPKSFEEISKNEGISFLILDPTETHLQILHHGHVFGGNWNSPTKKLAAVLGCDAEAKPVLIIQKSIKNIKEKSCSFDDFKGAMENEEEFTGLDVLNSEFQFKNILPIPNFLTKIFIRLDKTSPFQVAKAFMEGVLEKDKLNISIDSTDPPSGISILNNSAEDQDQAKPDEELETNGTMQNSTEPLSTEDIFHVIQFCHLCAIGKIPPISYSLSSDPETTSWFKNLTRSMMNEKTHPAKRQAPSTPDSDSESGVSSPELKMSKKDNYLINTMIKLHDTMDKSSRSKEEKEPGFNRLKAHRKNLILNASAIPPFTKAADNPTEFYTSFLSKKSQFKAKDMLMHRFHTDKVAFNPNPTFITNLWNSEFFWILPDHPSGISIFYCPETKSSNSSELERERNLALADKINASDIEKLAKQKMSLPTSLMDLVWQTQNLLAVVSLCFGPSSHSASFLQSWVDHMYDNRILYSSSHTSDPYFFAKVLYSIDSALQKHWRSCSSTVDRASVNDNVLRKSDVQESILDLNFTQILPKSIQDKVSLLLSANKDDKDKGNGLGRNGRRFPGATQDQKDKQDLVYDNDKNHQHWRLKENENFSKVFYSHQKDCPKTSEGKSICMKFFLRGVCTKSCPRVHNLSSKEKNKFEAFVTTCRELAPKADF